MASAGFIATLRLRLGRLAFDAAGVNTAAFFAFLKPRKSVNEAPPHGLPERSKDAPELCPDNSRGYVHLAQQREPLYVPLVTASADNLAGLNEVEDVPNFDGLRVCCTCDASICRERRG